MLILILSLPFATPSMAQQLYDIKDLEVLDRQQNFEEFLLHVNDIRPSERGKHWKEMYQTMSIGLIEYKLKTKDFSEKSFTQIEQIGRSSALVNDEVYQLKRTQYVQKYLTECFNNNLENKTKCETALNAFWYFSDKDADVALYFTTLLEKHGSTVDRWPFYQIAIHDAAAPIYCTKPEVQKAIISKINLESFNEKFDNNYKTLLDKYVPTKCFEKMVPVLKEALLSPNTNGTDKELAMNLLEAKKLISSDEQDLYAVLFLLDGPVVGDKMNAAWKKVEFLSENFPKRQKIVEMIKNLDILPDKIFIDPELPRNKAIINLFAKNFPEFLDFYGKSCLEYIQNKNDTSSNLSSTYQCHKFLKTAKANSLWISDSIQSKYSALKK